MQNKYEALDKNDDNSDIKDLYKKIFPYLKPYLSRAILGFLCAIPIGAFEATVAMALKPYMDSVLVEKNLQISSYIPYLIIGFTLIQGLFIYLSGYLIAWAGSKTKVKLMQSLYNKLLNMESAFFDSKSSGLIISRFSIDASIATDKLLSQIKMLVTKSCSAFFLVCVLFYNSWQLCILAVGVLCFAIIPMSKVRKKISFISRKSVDVAARLNTYYNEAFGGNKIIKSYNLFKNREENFIKILNETFSLGMKQVQVSSLLTPFMYLIASLGIASVIGIGGHLILTKQISSGNFVSFIAALVLLYTPVKSFGNNYIDFKGSLLAMERVFKILDYTPSIKNKENPIEFGKFQNNIKFENVWFEYEHDIPILKNINLEVQQGETIAFVGNSGGGKSTIVNLLPRFYDIKEGKVTIDNIDIRDISLEDLRENISVVFQDNFLFEGTIKNNILIGSPNATEEELNNAVENAFLKDFIAGLDNGIETWIGERGVLLSGGQKQRIAIARAFLKNAPIVVLDEATSALDNKSELVVQKAIDALMQNRTVFVIAHRLSTIKNADRIAVINSGEIVEVGSHDNLMQIQEGFYQTLYNAQFKTREQAEV